MREEFQDYTVKFRKKMTKKYAGFSGALIGIYLFVFTFSVFLGFSEKALAGMDYSDIKIYVDSVTVEKGDTLWSIAKAHHSEFYSNTLDYVMAIKECNNLEGDLLIPGMNIMVPYTERR